MYNTLNFLRDRRNNDRITGEFAFTVSGQSVPAHRHLNIDGYPGGWVAESAYVDPTCYVDDDAVVYENAQVTNNSKLLGKCRIHGNARISETILRNKEIT